MKKVVLLIAMTAILLPSCKRIHDSLDNRLDTIEQTFIPTINEQVDSINESISQLEAVDKELQGYISALQSTATNLQEQISATNENIEEVEVLLQNEISTTKADLLAQLNATKVELESKLAQINTTIATLQAEDKELDTKIQNLQTHIEDLLNENKEWVEATFVTLELHNALAADIATIKTQISAINTSIAELETRLSTKITEDITDAVKSLDQTIQTKVKEITDNYTSAIATAKEELTSAYTETIQTAISSLEASMKSWVGEQLSNYYTIAETEALLDAMEQEFNNQLNAQKSYLENLIGEISTATTKSIADNRALIDNLQASTTSLQGDVADNASAIAQNATAIATNAQDIINNTKVILANSGNIEDNATKMANNKSLIEANSQLIDANKSAIEALKVSANAEISQNASNIATNAENISNNATLINSNTTAILNNAAAISQNSADIIRLHKDLEAAKESLTSAYESAINTAITNNNGEIDAKIAAEVNAIYNVIEEQTANINLRLNEMSSLIEGLETEINNLREDLTDLNLQFEEHISALLNRIQSLTYIPTYSDGCATVRYYQNTRRVTLDFEVSPKDAIAELAAVWENALSVKATYTQTRALAFVNLPVLGFEADYENGVISVTASGQNLSEEFMSGEQTASVSLAISDGNNSLTSDYIPMVPMAVTPDLSNVPNNQIWYLSSNGEVITPYASDVFGATIVSNSYKELYGVITFDDDVTKLGKYAFNRRENLTKIVLPNSVTEIGEDALSNTNLESFTIPNSVTTIGNSAFWGCKFTNITIPNSVTTIGVGAFTECKNLSVFEGKFATEDKRSLVINNTLVAVAPAGLTSYTIPNNITEIASRVFRATDIESISIPNSVVAIGREAFLSCHKLKSVTIPDNVTTLGDYAFFSCNTLETLVIGDGVQIIERNTCMNCPALTTVYLGANITTLGETAFYPNGTSSNLTSVYLKATTPPAIHYYPGGRWSSAYGSFPIRNGITIYVPNDAYETYTSFTGATEGIYTENWYAWRNYLQPYNFN